MNGAHILIVDDDPALLEALPETLRLRMEGLSVDTSDSAPAALEKIAATDYDALIVDIKMPGMDGLELLAEIKKHQPDTPTLLITGHGDHDLAVQALRGGAYDYVTKPIDRDYFVSSLSRAMQCHRLSHEVAQKRQELEQHATELADCVRERTHELRDLLHREQAARTELDETRRKLEEATRQREEFIAMVAHDLGGPLTTVRGYAEILGRSSVRPELHERARTVILSETRRMARLVEDLADPAHLSAGRFSVEPVPCDLAEIAREQVDLASARSDRHSIHLEAPPELSVRCDCDRIAQVLFNLLANAIKYTAGGEIQVRLWQEPLHARFTVSDTGPGVPAESLELIFEPGRRLAHGEDNGQSEGAGLGLHIARGIVDAHGGRIWVESSAGQGATFHVSLPAVPREGRASLAKTGETAG